MNLPDYALHDALKIADRLDKNRPNKKWGQTTTRSEVDNRVGTVAEFAIRWAFGMPAWNQETYPGYDKREDADVGDNVEVRSTKYKSGRLLVRQKHDDVTPRINRDYCLVVVNEDWTFRIPGWLPMREIIPIWHTFRTHGRPDAKAVHQNQLKPLSQLIILDGDAQYNFLSRNAKRVQGGRQARLF